MLPMAIAFLNGAFVDLASASVAALDSGLQHGVGVFDTMLGGNLLPSAADRDDALDDAAETNAPRPWLLDLEEHLDRLAESCRELGLTAELNTEGLARAALETVARSGLARARLRITVTGGPLNLLRRNLSATGEASSPTSAPTQGQTGDQRPGQPTVLIVASAATEYPPAMLASGVSVVLADSKANPFNIFESHKTLNYWWRLRELQHAAAKDAAEALVFSVTNHLVGGCVSSALLVTGGQVRAPIVRGEEGQTLSPGQAIASDGRSDDPQRTGSQPAPVATASGGVLPSAALPSISRRWAIRELAGEGHNVRREMLTISDVLAADEIILLNSSWGALPVVQVESSTVGSKSGHPGRPGPIGQLLVKSWAAQLAAPPVW